MTEQANPENETKMTWYQKGYEQAKADIQNDLVDAKRYRFLLDSGMIFFKPADYDGLPYGRWDLFEKTNNNDFDNYIDNIRRPKAGG